MSLVAFFFVCFLILSFLYNSKIQENGSNSEIEVSRQSGLLTVSTRCEAGRTLLLVFNSAENTKRFFKDFLLAVELIVTLE